MMPSPLDLKLKAAVARITAPDGQLPLGEAEVRGRTMPVIAAAPPTLAAHFAHFCAQHGDAPFIVAEGERLSFAETHAVARRVAAGLIARHGVSPGDRVGIAARNAPAWIVAYMGIVIAGGIATLLNGWWEGDELADAIRDVGCTLVIADAPRADRLAGRDHGARIIVLDMAAPIAAATAPVAGDADVPFPALAPDDPATILFTSGSTGRSKGALCDHRSVVQATMNYVVQTLMMLSLLVEEGRAPTRQPATLLNLPLFHVTAEVPVLLQSFVLGRKLVLMPKWDAAEAMRLIEAEAITYFVGVPLMSFEILTHPDRDRFDLSTCVDYAAGGAPRPVEHVRRLATEMGDAKPLLGYGLTETNAVGCGNFRENYLEKPNSTGLPSLPLVDLAILDDAGAPVADGERGEVCIRSVCNFREYWGRPADTAACFTADGYFRTGDIGLRDADGYLFIVDRKKDIIIRGGENISCLEVEDALYADPRIAEAAVFGLPSVRFGEVPVAVVHSAEGASLTPDTVIQALRGRIAPFKLPVLLWIAPDPLPRLGTEKIDKRAIASDYAARAGDLA